MSVARVYGKCDGYDILFRLNTQNGLWETTVPFDESGEYVVEIRAVDDVGNESYYATLVFTVDTTHLCVHIKILELSAQAVADGFLSNAETSEYVPILVSDRYCAEIADNHYTAEVVRCDLCGRF